MAERALTAGERQMAAAQWGSSINLDIVVVTDRPYMSGQGVPMVPYGKTIYWPEGMRGRPYSDDFSTASLEVRGDFMHELTHIWQNQHGKNTSNLIVLHAVEGEDVYKLSGVNPNSTWDDLNGEQQGEVVKNIYMMKNGGTVTNGTLSLQQSQDILSRTPWHTQAPMEPIKPVPGEAPECFVRGTPILLADGSSKPIEQVQAGDLVLAFAGRSALQPRRVVRLFENVTTELLELTPAPSHRRDAEDVGFGTLTVTPGHSFLTADGTFEEIGKTNISLS